MNNSTASRLLDVSFSPKRLKGSGSQESKSN
jgi:hypothetical protein